MRTKYHVAMFNVNGIDLRDDSSFEDAIVKVLPDVSTGTLNKAMDEIILDYQRYGYDEVEVYFQSSFIVDSMDLYLKLLESVGELK